MAFEASDTGQLVEVMSEIYGGAKQLVEIDRGITPEELELMNRLMLAKELAILANNDTLNVMAMSRGKWRTSWFERRNNDTLRDIAQMKADHERWIASLDTGSRLYIPFGHQPPQRMTARDRQSQTA